MNPVTFLDETGRELARAGAPHLGDLCMWDLDGVDVARDLARGVFADAGHGELIVDPGAESALTRARATIRTAGLIVRPFKRPNPDTPAACGIYREVERDGERGNDYVLGARVRVVTGGLAAVDPLEGSADSACLEVARAIADKGNHLLSHTDTAELGAATVTLLEKLGGIRMRSRGGAYFVPAVHSPAWGRATDGLAALCGAERIEHASGGHCWRGGKFRPTVVPLYGVPKAVAEVAESARGSLQEELEALAEELADASSEGFHKRSPLVSRIEKCEALIDRARLYQDVLAGAAERIAESVRTVRAGFESELAAYDAGKRPGKADAPPASGPRATSDNLFSRAHG